jgi:hypothetical protein
MKRAVVWVTILGVWVGPICADTPPASPVNSLKIVFVWALGKNPDTSKEVELDILTNLAKLGVSGVSAGKLFPNGVPESSADVISAVRAQGCDSFLAVYRTSTFRWDTDPKEHTLKSFLARRGKILNPTNEVETENAAPIVVANTYGNANWEIDKGEYLVFDMTTLNLRRRGKSSVKSASDLPQSKYYQLVADKVVERLTHDGLLPAAKK